jgi:hypothetical protein
MFIFDIRENWLTGPRGWPGETMRQISKTVEMSSLLYPCTNCGSNERFFDAQTNTLQAHCWQCASATRHQPTMAAPTAPVAQVANPCTQCGIRPRWFDANRGALSPWCGNTCRTAAGSGNSVGGGRPVTATVRPSTASTSTTGVSVANPCTHCGVRQRWYDSSKGGLSPWCGNTCRTAAGGSSSVSGGGGGGGVLVGPAAGGSGGGGGTGKPVSFRLFHGTPADKARSILQTGFQASTSGQLGAGLYLAREEKAQKFADSGRHGSARGVVFAVVVNLQNPLFKHTNTSVGDWAARGHDGVRVDDTQMSSNMEWCVLPHRATIAKWRYSNEPNEWHNPSDSP